MPVRVEDIAQLIDPIAPTVTTGSTLNYFFSYPQLHALPVVSSGAPIGIITRHAVTEALASPNGHSLFSERPVTHLLRSGPVMVEAGTAVALIAKIAAEENSSALTDGVVVLQEGRYIGLISPQEILKTVARENTARARAMRKSKMKAEQGETSSNAPVGDTSKFMAFVSHEIRTPLTGILGVADLLQDYVKSEESRKMARTISQSGQHLDRLLGDLLDLSRLDAGKLPIDPAPFGLRDFANEAKSLWQSRVNDRRLDLRIQIDSSAVGRVEADATRIRQILFNLMSNALKFTEKGYVKVTLSTEDAPNGLKLIMSVADTGCGISEADKTRLFKAFEQAAASTANIHGGSGLGLAIARSLSVRMGGTISLADNPDGGSIFTVELPVIAAGPRLAASQTTKPKRWEMQLGKLLLVEDHEASAFVISRALEAAGWDVDHVTTAQDAAAIADRATYQAILTDLHLGASSGDDILRDLRSRENRNALTPIIAITADVSHERRGRCEKLGYADVIAKPIRPRTLVATLADILMEQDPRVSTQRQIARLR